jgi:replicative DNA helicase
MIEQTILRNLLKNEPYTRKVLPFLKEEYFSLDHEKILFNEAKNFLLKYNTMPSFDAIAIELDNIRGLRQDQIDAARDELASFRKEPEDTNQAWLVDATEQFCQDKALYSAIHQSIEIMDDKGNLSKGAIPKLLSDALGVSFDPNIGHDYLEQADDRFEYYHRVLQKIPFDLDFFNKITADGLPKKTLNVCLAATGAGKSLFMCHCAAHCLIQGRNVLYITLELAEEEVAKRIDANLMNIALDDLMVLPKPLYDRKSEAVKAKTNGKLIVKEYPTAGAGTTHFRALLNELSLKKNFIPDIIYVDYLNICISSRIKPGVQVNSYSYIKSIAEELRGLAVEFNLPIVTATQVNRSGFASSDVELTDTSESFGLPATADFMFALIATEELDKLNQIMVKQLKNRYNDPTINRRFVLGIDRAKMRLYNAEVSAQAGLVNTGQEAPTGKNKFDKLKV